MSAGWAVALTLYIFGMVPMSGYFERRLFPPEDQRIETVANWLMVVFWPFVAIAVLIMLLSRENPTDKTHRG